MTPAYIRSRARAVCLLAMLGLLAAAPGRLWRRAPIRRRHAGDGRRTAGRRARN